MADQVNTMTTSGYKMSASLKTHLALNTIRPGVRKILVAAEKHAFVHNKKAAKAVTRDTSEV